LEHVSPPHHPMFLKQRDFVKWNAGVVGIHTSAHLICLALTSPFIVWPVRVHNIDWMKRFNECDIHETQWLNLLSLTNNGRRKGSVWTGEFGCVRLFLLRQRSKLHIWINSKTHFCCFIHSKKKDFCCLFKLFN